MIFLALIWILFLWKTHKSVIHSQIPLEINDFPRGKKLPTNDSMSGCLLVMDDNARLVEWLAYHYFTAKLRYLIVAIDPRSTTSPQSILDRWTSHGFYYEIWQDEDYMGARVLNKRQKLDELGRQDLTTVHRVRQKAFYQFCLEHLEAQHRNTWTLLIDVDEYLVVNQEEMQNPVQHQEIMSSLGGVYQFVKEAAALATTRADDKSKKSTYVQFASPCVTMPRLLFGTKQDTTEDADNIPSDVQLGNALDTMRWFYHANYSEFDRNGLGKTILDLARIQIPKPHFPHPVNPHRPFQNICRDPKRIADLNQHAFLRVHHYLSTWETYSYRNDSRRGGERSREAWEYRAISDAGGKTRDAVPWLDGFVRRFGRPQATKVLKDAGLPDHYKHPPQVNDQWKFLFADEFLDKRNKQSDSKFGQFLQNRTTNTKGRG